MSRLFLIQFTATIFFSTLFLPLPQYFILQLCANSIILLVFIFFHRRYTAWLLVSIFAVSMALWAVFLKFHLLTHTDREASSLPISWIIVWWRKDWTYLLSSSSWGYILRDSTSIIPYWTYVSVTWFLSATNSTWFETLFPTTHPLQYWVFDYDIWRWSKWIAGDIYKTIILPSDVLIDPDISDTFLKVKSTLITRIIAIYWHTQGSLLSGILIWDIFFMSWVEYASFIKSSLVHLIAVSGWNLLFVWRVFGLLFFFLPFYIRVTIVCAGVIMYGYTVWYDSSILRAIVMFLLVYIYLLLWRSGNFTRSMMYAWVVLLLIDPLLLHYDLGFLLSFWALTWIIGLASFVTIIEKFYNFSLWSITKQYIAPTIGASLWTYPILLFFIWPINLLGVVWNLLVIPIIPLVMSLWLLSILFQFTLMWDAFTFLCSWGLSYIYYIASLIERFGVYFWRDWASNYWLVLVCIVWYICLYCYFLYIKSVMKKQEN